MSVSFCSVALLTACADFQRSIVAHLRELMAATSTDYTVVLTEDDVPGASVNSRHTTNTLQHSFVGGCCVTFVGGCCVINTASSVYMYLLPQNSAHTVSRTTEQMQAYTGKMKVFFYCSYLGIFGGIAKPAQFESSSFLY